MGAKQSLVGTDLAQSLFVAVDGRGLRRGVPGAFVVNPNETVLDTVEKEMQKGANMEEAAAKAMCKTWFLADTCKAPKDHI